MAHKYGPIKYTPCRTERGKFAYEASCRRKKAKRKTRKATARKTSRKTARKSSGFYRDKGGFCRKKGKRGFAKESSCKKAGVR